LEAGVYYKAFEFLAILEQFVEQLLNGEQKDTIDDNMDVY